MTLAEFLTIIQDWGPKTLRKLRAITQKKHFPLFFLCILILFITSASILCYITFNDYKVIKNADLIKNKKNIKTQEYLIQKQKSEIRFLKDSIHIKDLLIKNKDEQINKLFIKNCSSNVILLDDSNYDERYRLLKHELKKLSFLNLLTPTSRQYTCDENENIKTAIIHLNTYSTDQELMNVILSLHKYQGNDINFFIYTSAQTTESDIKKIFASIMQKEFKINSFETRKIISKIHLFPLADTTNKDFNKQLNEFIIAIIQNTV